MNTTRAHAVVVLLGAALLAMLVLPPVPAAARAPGSGAAPVATGHKPGFPGSPRVADSFLQVASVDKLANEPRTRLHVCRVDHGWLCGSVPVPVDRADPAGPAMRIGFMVLPHRDPGARRDVLVSTAGGPGLASTSASYRGFMQFVLGPLLAHRDLLVVDRRGTGRSAAIDCPDVQDGIDSRSDFIRSYGECGDLLGDDADRYGAGDVALDLDAIRKALAIPRFSQYASSYGTVDEQAYATRFPERVRVVVADSAIPVRDRGHAYLNDIDVGPAADRAVRLGCQRAPACAAAHPGAEHALGLLARALRRSPVVGRARDIDGVLRRVRVDEVRLAAIVFAGSQNPPELAAVAAALRRGDPAPLLRLAANSPLWPGGDPHVKQFSDGDNAAGFCNDMDPAWDRTDPLPARRRAFAEEQASLPAVAFRPLSVVAITRLFPPELCIRWPAPDRFTPAVRPGAQADVPALLLSGDLDTTVPTSVSRLVRTVFPEAPLVRIAGAGHDTTGWSACARTLTARFIRTLHTGDTSCGRRPSYVFPASSVFPVTADVAPPAAPLPPDASTGLDHRIATVAVRGVLDAWKQSFQTPGAVGRGHGLRGGSFHFDYASFGDHAVIRLHRIRFADDVVLAGRSSLFYGQRVRMRVHVVGPDGHDGILEVHGGWSGGPPYGTLVARGTLGHGPVAVRMPAN